MHGAWPGRVSPPGWGVWVGRAFPLPGQPLPRVPCSQHSPRELLQLKGCAGCVCRVCAELHGQFLNSFWRIQRPTLTLPSYRGLPTVAVGGAHMLCSECSGQDLGAADLKLPCAGSRLSLRASGWVRRSRPELQRWIQHPSCECEHGSVCSAHQSGFWGAGGASWMLAGSAVKASSWHLARTREPPPGHGRSPGGLTPSSRRTSSQSRRWNSGTIGSGS